MTTEHPPICVRDMTMAYGSRVIQSDVTFDVNREEIFAIMGPSGCGKSTLLKHLIGLLKPHRGSLAYSGTNFWNVEPSEQQKLRQNWGITYQGNGLFSSMTLEENAAVPLQLYTDYSDAEIKEIIAFKMALVGLAGFQDYYPHEISGGMQKRAALVRALALDPQILFFDEPSSGLDPLSSARLDELILLARDQLGASVVIVTHELASIFAIADRCIFLDSQERRPLAIGPPAELRDNCEHEIVRDFLARKLNKQD
ncbi:putative ribonucleotide transport ATP-binding protein mkl [BD1-7 clade bacterium]|uniref:Putative ribonucleotide transport ATP-binding protein mkl n=1 Tax=BD1-7 clade bacterium TaxID=2029982 RepID=A0A5S9QXP7_9GAMM|nr:putative ribonucleotide transport ATP-binding protein mkl [BD1-7 clade bacterium]